MNYFLDTEFSTLPWDNGSHLISLGLVSEDGRSYFACLSDIDLENTSEFVLKNVVPYLPPIEERKSSEVICTEIEDFIGNDTDTKFWAIFPEKEFLIKIGLPDDLVESYYTKYADYDFQLFRGLWKNRQYPKSWSKTCNNLTELLRKLPKDTIPVNQKAHDPLSDAKWNFEVWKLAKK